MKKILFLLIVLAAGACAAVYFGFGPAIKEIVERGGKWALETDTKLESARVNPLAGSVALNDFRIGAPAGFKQDPTFAVDSITVAADLGSLRTDTIKIKKIEIDEPEIGLEISSGGTNFGKLLAIVKSKTGGGPKKPAPESGDPGKKLLIQEIVIKKPKLTVAQSILLSASQTVTLADIVLKDVGSESKPADFAAMLEQVFTAILNAAANSPELKLPGNLQSILQGDASKFTEQLKGHVEDLKKQGQDAIDQAKKQAEELKKQAEGLGDIFKKKD